MRILITGSSGLLGSKLKGHFPLSYCPAHQEMDIHHPLNISDDLDLVIHCAAIKTTECDKNKLLAAKTNVLGTYHIAELCCNKNAKLVYISTDYVFKGDRGNYSISDEVLPQNYYAETKLAGEYVAKAVPNHLIIRLSFFPDVYPYDNAFTDQWTTRVTVSEAAERIANLIKNGATGLHHIAGKKQTVYEFAKVTSYGKPIKASSIKDQSFQRPRDTSLI